MRLIDADEFLILEAAAYNKAQAKTSDKITRLVNEVVHKKTQMLVSDAPTAYDVDKVVERITDLTAETFKIVNNSVYIPANKTLEIVKGGK